MTYNNNNNRKNIEVNTVVSDWKPEGLDQTRTQILKVEPNTIQENEAVSANVRSQLSDDNGSSFLTGNVWLDETAKTVIVSAYSSRIENSDLVSSHRVDVEVWMRVDGTVTITIKGASNTETQIVNGNTQIEVAPIING